jgi:hypothetical protein
MEGMVCCNVGERQIRITYRNWKIDRNNRNKKKTIKQKKQPNTKETFASPINEGGGRV